MYLYNANGSKQIKKFFENGKQKNAEYYVGSIIYETDSTEVTGDKLKYVMTGDGLIARLQDGNYRYEYFTGRKSIAAGTKVKKTFMGGYHPNTSDKY